MAPQRQDLGKVPYLGKVPCWHSRIWVESVRLPSLRTSDFDARCHPCFRRGLDVEETGLSEAYGGGAVGFLRGSDPNTCVSVTQDAVQRMLSIFTTRELSNGGRGVEKWAITPSFNGSLKRSTARWPSIMRGGRPASRGWWVHGPYLFGESKAHGGTIALHRRNRPGHDQLRVGVCGYEGARAPFGRHPPLGGPAVGSGRRGSPFADAPLVSLPARSPRVAR